MNIVIFAGGIGTRLWPLSRKKSPKQFEQVVGDKSTLQLAVDRLTDSFDPQHMYISTNAEYVDQVHDQLPIIPSKNIIGEPKMRDIGPAVGLATSILVKKNPNVPMAIMWSDHLVREEKLFCKILKNSEKLISREPNKIVFISQKPRFASQNLGWIKYGKVKRSKNGIDFHGLESFKYRPDLKTAERYFKSGKHAWNLGYFITTPQFLINKYKQFVPDMYKHLSEITKHINKPSWGKVLNKIYPSLEKISFDNAILERLSHDEAYVVSEDLGWSDVGAWEALKEALQSSSSDNVTRGKVILSDSSDSLVYNYNRKQTLIAIDASGLIVINTHDVVLVCKKDSVPKIKKLVEGFAGTDHEHLT